MPADPPSILGRLFDAHAAAMVLYARQWLDAREAEDVVQDVFASLVARPRAAQRNRAWLFRSVRNACLNALRSRWRRRKREQIAGQRRGAMFEVDFASGLDAAAAEAALTRLLPMQREVVVLRIWSGLTLAEVAAITGLSVSSVFEQYRAALAKLKELLECPCTMKQTT